MEALLSNQNHRPSKYKGPIRHHGSIEKKAIPFHPHEQGKQIRNGTHQPPAIAEGRNEPNPLVVLLEAPASPPRSLCSPMAPSLLAVAASPFLVAGSSCSRRPLVAAATRRAGLRVAALKYDPAKVGGLGAEMMRSGFESPRNQGFWVGF